MRILVVIGVLSLLELGCGRTEPYDLNVPHGSLPDGGTSVEVDAGSPDIDAGPGGQCILAVSPSSIDLGKVPLGSTASATLTVINVGDAGCTLGAFDLSADTDGEFSTIRGAVAPVTVEPGEDGGITLPVSFVATSDMLPRQKTGIFEIHKSEPGGQTFAIPLEATITVGCLLQASPNPLDFGNVPLNTNGALTLTLQNAGDAPCDISAVSLDPTGSPLFTLVSSGAALPEIPPNGSDTVSLAFNGHDSTDPHLRTSNLFFTVSQPSGLPLLPTQQETIPVQAFINTACVAGSQWIYTVDDLGTFSIFNPLTLSFMDLGTLTCPDNGTPFSMAVDQSAVAWVEYSSGALYRVDTTTLECTPTSFQVNPDLTDFGMGFVFNPEAGVDTLYVSGTTMEAFNGGSSPSTLATISFPDLTLAAVGPISFGSPELTGTGDGQLWAFAPAAQTVTDQATLAQLDPATGNVITSYVYDSLGTGGYAMKFWGGSLWIFDGMSVYQVNRTDGTISTAIDNTNRVIVGAGVSTCAPVQ